MKLTGGAELRTVSQEMNHTQITKREVSFYKWSRITDRPLTRVITVAMTHWQTETCDSLRALSETQLSFLNKQSVII